MQKVTVWNHKTLIIEDLNNSSFSSHSFQLLLHLLMYLFTANLFINFVPIHNFYFSLPALDSASISILLIHWNHCCPGYWWPVCGVIKSSLTCPQVTPAFSNNWYRWIISPWGSTFFSGLLCHSGFPVCFRSKSPVWAPSPKAGLPW